MFKHSLFILSATMLMISTAWAQGGFLSSLRERALPGPNQGEQASPPAGAQVAQKAGQQPTPTPEEQAAMKKRAEASARRIARQMSWDAVPRDLFRRYAGRWEGNFWVYSPVGRKKQSQKVVVEYTPQSNGTLLMETRSLDLVSKQWIVQESAVYSVDGDTVTITVTRPNGSKQTQTGHYSDDQLFVRSNIKDGVEHYRERIRGNELLVDGYGVYGKISGDDHNVFIGRLRRVQ
jgi:hypothetical protein